MSPQLPHSNEPLPLNEDPQATKHRKGRTTLGTVLVMLGVLKVLLLIWRYGTYGSVISTLSEGDRDSIIFHDAYEATVAVGDFRR